VKAEYISNLIEALDFVKFRDLARYCIEKRGYVRPTVSDGWSDGGRDLRVYHVNGTKPVPVAFQTTVQWDWKTKLNDDLVAAKKKLGCSAFTYVTSRRIGDAEFAPFVTKALADHGVMLTKIDKQDLAQQLVDQDEVGWFLDLIGIESSASLSRKPSLRQEVADTFLMFSGDVQDFRFAMVEHALRLTLLHSPGLVIDELLSQSQAAIDFSSPDVFRSAVDRLQQRGDLDHRNGKFYLNGRLESKYSDARRLINQDWQAFRGRVQQVLEKYLPNKRQTVTAIEAATAVSERIGSIVHAYRDYQAATMQFAPDQRDIRMRYQREVSSVASLLNGFGIAEDRISECMKELSELEKDYFSVARLTAGEVFRKLMPSGNNALMNSLGRATGLAIYVEPSVMIPLMCMRLYRKLSSNKSLSAANRLFESAAELNVEFILPDIYLEECATHLIFAGRYAPIVATASINDLLYSENAFVAYYAAMGNNRMPFPQFLDSFGYRKSDSGFQADVVGVEARLGHVIRSYGVVLADVRRFRGSELIRNVAEQDLDHIYNNSHITKPSVLVRHDAAMLSFIREASTRSDKALMLVTWDRSLQDACRQDDYQWWCLDPVHAGDILALANPGGSGSMAIEIALMIENEELKRAAKLWDQLVAIEKDNIFDADLFRKANSFRNAYLNQQQSDGFASQQIASAWEQAKQQSAAG